MIQMLLVLFAVVLFSTILIISYSNLYDSFDIIYKGIYQLQGLKIADKYYQQISSEILGDYDKFDSLQVNYSNFNTVDTVYTIVYNINIQSSYCDSSGGTLSPDTLYQKIDIRIWCDNPLGSDTLWIGTTDNPITPPPILDLRL
ncbi:MAG: hypothetical protein KAW87_05530 [Candidatus Cloacimonetes bacterium]|nr:hypothetical protein [Candidatus Cloacimonadota bacterium]